MNRKKTDPPFDSSKPTEEVETLYNSLIDTFYDRGDRERARQIATELQLTLNNRPDVADSIRGEEIRSLIAELNGNLQEAIRRRECEIRKILELHSLACGSPGWAYVFRQYDYGDVSDRLDLLASLYANVGDWERAIATLRESKAYCEGHGIPFDGQDLLDEFEQERASPGRVAKREKGQLEQIDNALRDAYKEVGVSSDKIVSQDDTFNRFLVALNSRIPELQMTPPEIKERLIGLRKHGGLPKLGVEKKPAHGKSTA
jgi:tetratricopeptide (TPR) repeat protein